MVALALTTRRRWRAGPRIRMDPLGVLPYQMDSLIEMESLKINELEQALSKRPATFLGPALATDTTNYLKPKSTFV